MNRTGSLLLVRHGPGRGRLPGYMDRAVESLSRRRPDVTPRLRLHETGRPLPSLDDVGCVLFWLADPLKERYPECHAEAVAIEREARAVGARVVTSPDALSNAVKSRQADHWRAAGIETPPVARARSLDEVVSLARSAGGPVVVRGDEEHYQEGVRLLADEASLRALRVEDLRFPAAVSPLWDVRATWRARRPENVHARLHHKRRAYVLGDRVVSEHVFFSTSPIVCARTSTFARYHAWPRLLRPLVRRLARDEIREDREHWRSENRHAETLRRAAEALGLGYAAIDYAERADGTAVLWEANPYPWLPPPSAVMLPRERAAEERLAHYVDEVADFLARLATAEGARPAAPARGARPEAAA